MRSPKPRILAALEERRETGKRERKKKKKRMGRRRTDGGKAGGSVANLFKRTLARQSQSCLKAAWLHLRQNHLPFQVRDIWGPRDGAEG